MKKIFDAYKNNFFKKKWLFLPIETKTRELESKILLSCCAAEKGFGVIIGPSGFNYFGNCPRGIYFGVAAAFVNKNFIKHQVLKLKNKFVCLDEEGILFLKDSYIKERTSKENLALTSKFFCWGQKQFALLEKFYPEYSDKFVISGSPRVDIWKPTLNQIVHDKAKELQTKIGNFILIVSNFSASISINGSDFVERQQNNYGLLPNKAAKIELQKVLSYYRKIYKYFWRDMIQIIKSFPDQLFIIRPHPGDDFKIWHNLERDHKNLKCIYDGNLSEWILASDFIIQNNCTSAIEAFFLNKNSISFIPFKPIEKFEFDLPNYVSLRAEGKKDLKKIIIKTLKNKNTFYNSDKKKKIYSHILDSKKVLSADVIVNELLKLSVPYVEYNFSFFKLKSYIPKLINKIKEIVSGMIFTKLSINKNYNKQKNPGFTFEEIENYLCNLKRYSGRFQNIKIKQISTNLFFIYK